MKDTNRTVAFFEGLVIVAIILVLVQTFLEDFAVIAGWTTDVRTKLSISSFFFDLFFTVEFLVRLYYSIVNKKTMKYLLRERGWIDFLASIPLLMFNSGPTMLTILFKGSTMLNIGGIFNVLKVIKAIRIARILRFLRIIKLFRNIRYVDSKMAQRHVATITTLSITVIVFSLFAISLTSAGLGLPGIDSELYKKELQAAEMLVKAEKSDNKLFEIINNMDKYDTNLLIVKKAGKTIYSRYYNGYYKEHFAPGDYSYFTKGELELFFDSRIVSIQSSLQNILFFIVVLLTVAAFLLFYSPHFAITVTDPLRVIERGMSESDYNLEVKILSPYEEDEVFRVAKLYNEVFLPMKDRNMLKEEQPSLDLTMNDIQGILPEEQNK